MSGMESAHGLRRHERFIAKGTRPDDLEHHSCAAADFDHRHPAARQNSERRVRSYRCGARENTQGHHLSRNVATSRFPPATSTMLSTVCCCASARAAVQIPCRIRRVSWILRNALWEHFAPPNLPAAPTPCDFCSFGTEWRAGQGETCY